MTDELEKTEQPNSEDIVAAIMSFNDVGIITNLFRDLGWTYTFEIQETVTMAKQNANLSIKFKAIKHLRELLREAAEASGYVANVSQSIPNAQGGVTTFHAKRIAGALNPVKKIESTIKEPENDKTKKIRTKPIRHGNDIERRLGTEDKTKSETEPYRDGDRRQSQARENLLNRGSSRGTGKRPECTGEVHEGIPNGADSSEPIRDTRRASLPGDGESGGTESADGGKTSERRGGDDAVTNNDSKESNPHAKDDKGCVGRDDSCPCVKTRPPTCNQDLFPGISTSAEEN
jgi:hypothetical protein